MKDLPLYKEEFGENFNLGFEISKFPQLEDQSYKHDVCPKFSFKVDDKYFLLFVDFENVKDREYENEERYSLSLAINQGDKDNPEIIPANLPLLYQTENSKDIVSYLENMFN